MTTKKRKTPPSPRSPSSVSTHEEPRSRTTKRYDSMQSVVVEEGLHEKDTEPKAIGFGESDDDTVLTDPGLEPRAGEDTQVPAEADQRTLTPTLLKIFSRRRKEIGVSVEQVARLSGISHAMLERFEHEPQQQPISYDQAVVLARVLGLSPDVLPGLRRRETRVPLDITLSELERTLLGAPLLRFEGQYGERFGGDVERAAASKAFTVRIDDDSLMPALQRGALLGFVSAAVPRRGGTLLLRHRRSSLLTLRRYEPPVYSGILPWQPSYPVGGEWHLCGALEVMLPPR